MELLKQIVPSVKRVIVLEVPSGTNYEESHKRIWAAGQRLGLDLISVQAESTEKIKSGISTLVTHRLGDALFMPPDTPVIAAAEEIARQAINEKLPTIGANVETVRKGLLASYSSDYYSLGQQGAMLVHKILRGARPTDLPIEDPSKLNMVINLKTAKAIGLKVPKEVLVRADEVIE
jgi:putative ABC transport system substrate-binding protein